MALKVFVIFLVVAVVLEFSSLCHGQGYKCLFTVCNDGRREVRIKNELHFFLFSCATLISL